MATTHATSADTATINHWLKSVLADSTKARQLKADWRKLMYSELPLSNAQKEHLSTIPATDAKELQAAIAKVVDHGGSIHIERDSEMKPGLLVVKPSEKSSESKSPAAGSKAAPEFSVGIFHCTFDANCRNWRCGWGPR